MLLDGQQVVPIAAVVAVVAAIVAQAAVVADLISDRCVAVLAIDAETAVAARHSPESRPIVVAAAMVAAISDLQIKVADAMTAADVALVIGTAWTCSAACAPVVAAVPDAEHFRASEVVAAMAALHRLAAVATS